MAHVPGFCSVSHSSKPARVVPSAKKRLPERPVAPITQWPPVRVAPHEEVYEKYIGRSATTGWLDDRAREDSRLAPSRSLTLKVALDIAGTSPPLTSWPVTVWNLKVREAADGFGLSTQTYSSKPGPV